MLDFRAHATSAWRTLGWMALLVSLVACIWLAERLAQAADHRSAALGHQARLAEQLRVARPSPSSAAVEVQTAADIERANAVIDRLTVPWEELFDAIESADARGLGLLSLIPNARARSVRLSGESRSVADVMAYADRMAAQAALSQVHLLSYTTTVRGDVPVVTFTLAGTWRQRP